MCFELFNFNNHISLRAKTEPLSTTMLPSTDPGPELVVYSVDNRNMMILHDKKTLVSKQYEYCLFKVLRLCYKQGLKISSASCGLRKTNSGIG